MNHPLEAVYLVQDHTAGTTNTVCVTFEDYCAKHDNHVYAMPAPSSDCEHEPDPVIVDWCDQDNGEIRNDPHFFKLNGACITGDEYCRTVVHVFSD
jgi:hypothetical protein